MADTGHEAGYWKPRAVPAARATGIRKPITSTIADPRLQPLYKLHGSENWRDADNQALMIIGGDKTDQINTHPTLRAYAQVFEERLMRPESKLMIIGYGFRDHHINRALARAVLRIPRDGEQSFHGSVNTDSTAT